jgi:hypothetical protein
MKPALTVTRWAEIPSLFSWGHPGGMRWDIFQSRPNNTAQTLTTRVPLPAHSLVAKPSFACPERGWPTTLHIQRRNLNPLSSTNLLCISSPHNRPIVGCINAMHLSRKTETLQTRLHGKRGTGNNSQLPDTAPHFSDAISWRGAQTLNSLSAAPLTQHGTQIFAL